MIALRKAAYLLLGAISIISTVSASSSHLNLPDTALGAAYNRSGSVLPRGYIVEFADNAEQHIASQTKRSLSSISIHEEFHKYLSRATADFPGKEERKRDLLDVISSTFANATMDAELNRTSAYITRVSWDHAGLFRGVSVMLASDHFAPLLSKAPGVLSVSPIRTFTLGRFAPAVASPELVQQVFAPRNQSGDGQQNKAYGPHRMIGVDRLHDEGFRGQGMTIGILDTGERTGYG